MSNNNFTCTNTQGQPTPLPGGVSYSPSNGANLQSVAGAEIVCRIPKAPVLTLNKVLGSNRVNAADQFTLQILEGGLVVKAADTSGTGQEITGGSTGSTTLAVGKTYTMSEVAKEGSGTRLVRYSSSLNCVNAWADSATVLPSQLGASLTPQAGDEISCTLRNTALGASLQVTQVLSPTLHRYPVVVTYQGDNGWADRTLSSPSNDAVSSDVQNLAALDKSVQFKVNLPEKWRVRRVTCSDDNTAVSGNPSGKFDLSSTANAFTLQAAYVRAGAKMQCTALLFAPIPY